MSDLDIDVLGIGTAIIDIFAISEDEEMLKAMGLSIGQMNLVDKETSEWLNNCLEITKDIPGGTVANTLAGIKSFGGNPAYIGKMGKDTMGETYMYRLQEQGIEHHLIRADNIHTSHSVIIVGKEGVRTMCTHIDSQCRITRDEVDLDMLSRAKILYLSGYMFDTPEGQDTGRYVMEIAKSQNKGIGLTLADAICVERHREEFVSIVDEYVTFLFANSNELCALYQTDTIEMALAILMEKSESNDALYTITSGKEGAIMISKGEVATVQGQRMGHIVDKTGAGAAFASGVLYGHLQGYDHQLCAELGNNAAASVLMHLGSKPEQPLSSFLPHSSK